MATRRPPEEERRRSAGTVALGEASNGIKEGMEQMAIAVRQRLSLVPAHVVESRNDPEIEAYFHVSYVEGTPPPTSLSLDAHNPTAQKAGRRHMWLLFHTGTVSQPLKEQLRLQIAAWRDCEY